MAKRKTVAITIDGELWELASLILPCSRSAFIEKQLRDYINTTDEITELKKEIKMTEDDLFIKQQKLKELQKIKTINSKDDEKISDAMDIVRGIIENNGVISQKQIRDISNIHGIYSEVLEKKIKEEDMTITKYTMEYVEKKI